MSAFFVAAASIDCVLSFLKDKGAYVPDPLANDPANTFDLGRASDDRIATLGRVIWTENMRSVLHRYRGGEADEAAEYAEAIKGYRFAYIPNVPPMVAAKVAQCIDYQSCEHDDFMRSIARTVLLTVAEKAVSSFADWDRAPWGIDDPKDAVLREPRTHRVKTLPPPAGAVTLMSLLETAETGRVRKTH